MSLTFRSRKPWTVHLLERLKAGESIRYYRGTEDDFVTNPETPGYCATLIEILECVKSLENRGRIRTIKQKVSLGTNLESSPMKVTDFIAIGAGK